MLYFAQNVTSKKPLQVFGESLETDIPAYFETETQLNGYHKDFWGQAKFFRLHWVPRCFGHS